MNHLEGHLYASFISDPKMNYPYLCLLVTGGHTEIWEVQYQEKYILHATTVDDAAGEAFDKGARILGLSYPGGVEIEQLATHGKSNKFKFTNPVIKSNPLNFSFSGIKTAILYKIKDMKERELKENIANIAASYQEVIIETLLDRLNKVIQESVENESL